MKSDIDFLIMLMKKFTYSDSVELDEEETSSTGGAGSTGTGTKNNVTTWSQIVGAKVSRGKANPLGKSGEKWASGVARTGPANPVERKKWSDVVQTKRDGPANQLT